jgi:2-succinyl-6-hydroxy-2,4-cyclohexadiene-1-carboxylate synthase
MIAGGSWHYLALGDRQAPALLFLHGFMGLATDWLEVAAALRKDYCCVLPDLPGHGKTTGYGDTEISFDTVADELAEFVDYLDLKQVALVGYSMGGRVALHTALTHPQRFAALVLESASPGLEHETERSARIALDEQRAVQLEQLGLHSFVDKWFDAPLFDSLKCHPEKLAALKESRLGHQADGIARILRSMSLGRQASLWDELGRLEMPVLLISGALDRKFTEIGERMEGQLRNCRRRVVDGAGHNTHLEQPEIFIEYLREFLPTLRAVKGEDR